MNSLLSVKMKSCITRTYGTKAFIEGRNKVEQWMKDAGLQTSIDNIGNIRGRLVITEQLMQKPLLLLRILIPLSTPVNLMGRWEY